MAVPNNNHKAQLPTKDIELMMTIPTDVVLNGISITVLITRIKSSTHCIIVFIVNEKTSELLIMLQ